MPRDGEGGLAAGGQRASVRPPGAMMLAWTLRLCWAPSWPRWLSATSWPAARRRPVPPVCRQLPCLHAVEAGLRRLGRLRGPRGTDGPEPVCRGRLRKFWGRDGL